MQELRRRLCYGRKIYRFCKAGNKLTGNFTVTILEIIKEYKVCLKKLEPTFEKCQVPSQRELERKGMLLNSPRQ